MLGPRGISVDNDGNVYVVGGGSNNVVVISPDGQRHRQILSAGDGLVNPRVLD
jgi:DNA-binding beta-propeller fold protein YncE